MHDFHLTRNSADYSHPGKCVCINQCQQNRGRNEKVNQCWYRLIQTLLSPWSWDYHSCTIIFIYFNFPCGSSVPDYADNTIWWRNYLTIYALKRFGFCNGVLFIQLSLYWAFHYGIDLVFYTQISMWNRFWLSLIFSSKHILMSPYAVQLSWSFKNIILVETNDPYLPLGANIFWFWVHF